MVDSPFGVKRVTKIRILGVFFSSSLVSVDNDNWTARRNKLNSILGQRDLSFVGRSLIVNVLGASCLWHVARTARMHLSKNNPSSVRIAGEAVSISYSGQPKACHKCGNEGHLASGCKNPRCYNCKSPGHRAADCDKQPLCGICLECKHPVANCPFLIFSANLSNNEEDPDYAGAAKSNSVGRV